MDLDLRKLRYFAVLAEHEHFGRAAAALFIAQPVLSRQIRALERELGCPLLSRTTRSVQLTAAGRQLATDAPGLIAAAESATRRVRETARGEQRVVVGFAAGLLVSDAVAAFARRRPDVGIELVRLNWYEQAEAVLDGRVDVGYLRGDFGDACLDLVAIGADPTVALMPADHVLARHSELQLADLEGALMLDAEARRSTTVEDKLERVAAGRGIVVISRSVAHYYARPDLVVREVVDGRVDTVWLASAADRRRALVHDFIALAIDVLAPGRERQETPGRVP